MSTVLDLPAPPSVNSLFSNVKGRGRIKTRAYKAWLEEAGWSLKSQRPVKVSGPYELKIQMPPTRGDLGNYEKAISDLLVAHHVVDDDKHCRKITIERDALLSLARVTVAAPDTWEHISDPVSRVFAQLAVTFKDAAE
jgi:crossover junction endodeoxyribonuclease RusA